MNFLAALPSSIIASILAGIVKTIRWDTLIVKITINLLDYVIRRSGSQLVKDAAQSLKEALQESLKK